MSIINLNIIPINFLCFLPPPHTTPTSSHSTICGDLPCCMSSQCFLLSTNAHFSESSRSLRICWKSSHQSCQTYFFQPNWPQKYILNKPSWMPHYPLFKGSAYLLQILHAYFGQQRQVSLLPFRLLKWNGCFCLFNRVSSHFSHLMLQFFLWLSWASYYEHK